MKILYTDEASIKENINFILSHFKDQKHLFPRNIMVSNTGQFIVNDINEVFEMFEKAEFIDCKINAYPNFLQYKGINRTPPNFLFIDLDLNSDDIKTLDKIKTNLLVKIKKKIKGHPTVLWTGGGYHIYLPIKFVLSDEDNPTLESIDRFHKFIPYIDNDLTTEFMRFAEYYFSSNKSDSNHRPSIRSCLIRIPGTINPKYSKPIRIIQKWDGITSPINYILKDFEIYLIQKRIDKLKDAKKKKKNFYNKDKHIHELSRYFSSKNIKWIEKLLVTPMEDNRKICLWLILIPYLLNIKKYSKEYSFQILMQWLDKCDQKRPLNFDSVKLLKNDLKGDKGYWPISKEKIKKERKELYALLQLNKLFNEK